MADKVTIFHNPRCSKSRETMALLEARGADITVVEYLVDTPSVDQLKSLVNKLGLRARDIVRVKEDAMQGLNLDLDNDEKVYKALVTHPILIERPIIVRGDKAVIGRPPENIAKLWS